MNVYKSSPLRAVRQVNAGQSFDRPDRSFDQDSWIRFWIRTVQRWGPRTPDGHGLVLAFDPDQKLEHSGGMGEAFTTVRI